jgi:restriction system protein
MPVPDFQTIMLPLLKSLQDRQEHDYRGLIDSLAVHFQLTPEEREEVLPSGRARSFDNRVGWACTHLKKAGLIEAPRRAVFRILPRGENVLATHPTEINNKFLSQFEEFIEFRAKKNDVAGQITPAAITAETETPEVALEIAYQTLRDNLSDELLTTIKGCSPAFFEKLVVDVIVSMGYGGSRREAGRAVGGTGDDGIDGIINEDRLGLDNIYLQAKRWEGTVGRPEIQKFAGALQGYRARKGIFITTSSFTRDAQEYTSRIESKIVLIDGQRLANLMIDHNVGVTSEAVYEVKRTDSDYFSEG